MKKIIFVLIINLLFAFCLRAQTDLHQAAHQWVSYQAWQLIINDYHPLAQYSVMNSRIGGWSDPGPDGDWYTGTVMAGAYREDETDCVYHIPSPYIYMHSCTHFWDADAGETQTWNYMFYPYNNSFDKVKHLWNGDYDLVIKAVCSGGPFSYGIYFLHCSYPGNLADAYKNNNIYINSYTITTGQTYNINPPIKLCTAFSENGATITKRICWELVGRICHLIEDSGVPAHAHDDAHPDSDPDYYESQWVPNHFMEKNWTHARDQGEFININLLNCPLKYILYTTNQITDRFPSRDGDGDCLYDVSGCDNFGEIIYEFYQQINPLNIPVLHYGNGPIPPGLMEATFNFSYTYSIRSVAGFLWYVYNQFGISDNAPPKISGFTPNPPVINGNSGVFQVQLEYGTPPFSYEWWCQDKPSNVTVSYNTPSAGKVTITYNNDEFEKNAQRNRSNPFTVYCRVWGVNSSFDVGHFCPIKASTNNGCPWIYVMDSDSLYQEDNNILNKSKFPENVGVDITDKYVLNIQPGIFDSIITVAFLEKSTDTSFINSVKLYSVDHPFGTKLCVTEDNQIAIFDSASVLSVKQAYLNENDITSEIQFHIEPKSVVDNDSLDYVYSEFDNNNFGNLGIITVLRSRYATNNFKCLDGFLSANLIGDEIFTSAFSRRENKSISAIPVYCNFDNPSISSINIDYYRDNEIRYLALANLDYSNFTINELHLIEATKSSQIDDLLLLFSTDSLYSKISPENPLVLKFQSIIDPPDAAIRDYIIEINGRIDSYLSDMKYAKLSQMNKNTKKNSLNSHKYKLDQNFPNPFNPITKISYSVFKQGFVNLKIYNILGKEIKSLVNEIKNPGSYIVEFNGSNLPSGIYFYKFDVNGYSEVKKMILVK